MATPSEMKKALLDELYSVALAGKLVYKQELESKGVLKRYRPSWLKEGKIEQEAKEEAEKYLATAMVKSVTKGGRLPDNPIDEPIAFSRTHSVFMNCLGVVAERTDGIKISEKAKHVDDAGGHWVFVSYSGECCAITVEEAFDRSLRELREWPDNPVCSRSEASAYHNGRVAGYAAGLIRATR